MSFGEKDETVIIIGLKDQAVIGNASFCDVSEEGNETRMFLSMVTDDRSIPSYVKQSFPVVLYEMLFQAELYKMQNVVCWLPHGRAFRIQDEDMFVKYIIKFWFRQSKLTSFQRQLGHYGFRKIKRGPDEGAYYHELFLRDKRFLLHRINRIRGAKKQTKEPNFYEMEFLPQSINPNAQKEYSLAFLPQPISPLEYASDQHARVSRERRLQCR